MEDVDQKFSYTLLDVETALESLWAAYPSAMYCQNKITIH